MDAQRREANGRIIERLIDGQVKIADTDKNWALVEQTMAEERFIRARRPFYRVYPGILTAMLRLNIEKIDISRVRPPLPELSLEFAKEYPLKSPDREITSIMFADCDDSFFVEHCVDGMRPGIMLFPREHFSITSFLDTMDASVRLTWEGVLQVVFGVCMISQQDSVLLQPRVLSSDREKFLQSGDMKYVEKARRRGVIGWDLGRDIPTPEEMEAMRSGGEPGRKSPHWRIGHAAIYHTGQGRTVPVLKWIDDIFVNKDLYEKVPHGYHGAETD